MRNFVATLVGKTIRLALSFRRGGGHALPGLFIEKLFPGYVGSMLAKLPEGVVIITGTNGKTTTTKIVTHLLEANGRRVLTNSTGSNLIRGIASSLAMHASMSAHLNYDIAVLEVDEATARRLVEQATPRWVVGLNVSRDQLDRYGEIDTIVSHIKTTMQASKDGVVTNADDPNLVKAVFRIKNVHYFGVSPKLKKYFPSDYELAAVNRTKAAVKRPARIDVELNDFSEQEASYEFNGRVYKTGMKLSGQHNFLNAAAALTLCRMLLPDVPPEKLLERLAHVSLAFGRGEKYRLKNGVEIELVLVKNPASFTQALSSYANVDASLMIAINDNIADGRDVSWLWDVNLEPLHRRKILLTSGSRAADMALRLSYDDIETLNVQPDLIKALGVLSQAPGPKIILSTYTAMLQLYSHFMKHGERI